MRPDVVLPATPCRTVNLHLLGDGAQHPKCAIKSVNDAQNASDVSYYVK